MAFNGSQLPFTFGAAANNSTNNNNLGWFYPVNKNNNMHRYGAYCNTHMGVPNSGGAFNAPPQQIPMGYNGQYQSMHAGMVSNQQVRPQVAYHPAAMQGAPMALGPNHALMPSGMHQSMPSAQAPLNGGFNFGHPHFQQRPAPMVASAPWVRGGAYNVLPVLIPAPAPVSAPRVATEAIDLTNDDDDVTVASRAPAPPIRW
jgi:hypothetical protein